MLDEQTTALNWLQALETALVGEDAAAIGELFADDCHWRDLLAFTWTFQQWSGRKAIATALATNAVAMQPRNFKIPAARTQPRLVNRVGRDVIEVIFEFDTRVGKANGVIRLVFDENSKSFRAWTLMTGLHEIAGAEEASGLRRPEGSSSTRDFAAENWRERRDRLIKYDDRDPTVLVVGAGQSGLSIAARLGALGIDTLVVDRWPRIGDNWRSRYRGLSLHNEIWANDLPYLPFPKTWTTYTSKDQLADWLESYASIMELNVWSGTELTAARYDEQLGHWHVELGRADGQTRTLRPRHIVLATGTSNGANRPAIPGLEKFAGKVIHSTEFESNAQLGAQKALVIGTGTSGHDVAQQLYCDGVETTLVQRSPTTVVSLRPSTRMTYDLYLEGPGVEDCDLLFSASAYPVQVEAAKIATKKMRDLDRPLLDALVARGFKIDFGPGDTGYQMRHLTTGGRYYINVGCSDLIIDGKVGLLQFSDIASFEPDGVTLSNGQRLEADLIVLATGYELQQEQVRRLFGSEVADRVGQIWGFDESGELAAMWQRTGQPGFWLMGGGLLHTRVYSQYLALQIKACELGLIEPSRPRGEGNAEFDLVTA